jgi:hypothetical protein
MKIFTKLLFPSAEPILPLWVARSFVDIGKQQIAALSEPLSEIIKVSSSKTLASLFGHIGCLVHTMTRYAEETPPHANYAETRLRVENALRILAPGSPAMTMLNEVSTKTSYPLAAAFMHYGRSLTMIPVYNEAQWLARQAVKSLSRGEWKSAYMALKALAPHLTSEKAWDNYALLQYTATNHGLVQYLPSYRSEDLQQAAS